jgi:ketosteroid isomerase-like protein
VSRTDVDVVLDQFEGVNERDFERVMDHYAEDVVLVVEKGFLNTGRFEGKRAVGEWFGDWFRVFAADYRFDIKEARELGDGVVLVVASHHGTGRASGAEFPARETAYLYRVRGGRVTGVQLFETREDALEAASLPEWSDPETH